MAGGTNDKGVELLKSYEKRFKEIDMVSLQKRLLKGDMIAVFKRLKSCHTKNGENLFSYVAESRTCSSGLKLQQYKFRSDTRKNFFF